MGLLESGRPVTLLLLWSMKYDDDLIWSKVSAASVEGGGHLNLQLCARTLLGMFLEAAWRQHDQMFLCRMWQRWLSGALCWEVWDMSQYHSETSFEESNCAGYCVTNFVGNKQPHLSGGCSGACRLAHTWMFPFALLPIRKMQVLQKRYCGSEHFSLE